MSTPNVAPHPTNGLPDHGNANGNSNMTSAIQRINSYLHNSLDLRAALNQANNNGTSNNSNSIGEWPPSLEYRDIPLK